MITTITYRAVNQTNGNWYAGSTQQALEDRIKQHLSYKGNDRFHNSLKKNPDDWKWEVLSEVEDDDRSHEQYILDGWVGTEFCLNVSKFANGGFGWAHIPDETYTKNGINVARSYHSLSEKDPELYLRHQKEKGIKAAKKVHEKTNEKGQSEHAVMMANKATEARAKRPEKTSKDAKNAANRVRDNNRSSPVKATYLKTGDVIVFKSLSLAYKLVDPEISYNGFRKRVDSGKETKGYTFQRI